MSTHPAVGLGVAGVSLLAGWVGQPYVHGNAEAINVIVTVFSILAGFLVGIIAIVGDVAMMTPGSWRAVEVNRRSVVNKLTRHKYLFLTYLVTLGLIFIALVIEPLAPRVTVWLERAYLAFGVFAFVLSLRLPSALMKAQLERIESEIESRRQQANIPPEDEERHAPL